MVDGTGGGRGGRVALDTELSGVLRGTGGGAIFGLSSFGTGVLDGIILAADWGWSLLIKVALNEFKLFTFT